ncbi:Aminoglycoside phosphotransferase domain-containing protein [Pleurotus pulmonarius]|nr:hypothetical protein EYR38_009957 [Pleurotus pulmonarius]
MQLRRLTCTSVLLACAIAVFAAPAPSPRHMIEREVDQDVEARNWDSEDMIPRYNVEDRYRAAVLEARKPPKPAARPATPRPNTPPGPRPNAPASRPNTPPAPRPNAPASRPNTPPVQRPNTPPVQKPNTPAPRPNAPPARRPNTPPPQRPNTQPGQKPAADQCGAKSNGKSKRAFSTTCQTNSLTLGGVTRPITQVAEQGNSAITYKVDGGWPDPTNQQVVAAYAKTGKAPGLTFADEANWLGSVDQLLAQGTYDGHNFIVFRGVTGKSHLAATNFAIELSPVMMGQGSNFEKCEALIKEKLDLVIREVRTYVDRFGILHKDVQPGNILWDMAATDPTLIDWGRAEDVGVGQWSPQIEAGVREQAEYSHLKGNEKLCGLS